MEYASLNYTERSGRVTSSDIPEGAPAGAHMLCVPKLLGRVII